MNAIELAGVGKRYRVSDGQPLLAAHLFNRVRGRAPTDVWALRDIDLEFPRGASVGIIGRNGSGKTTALRLMAGVTGPTTGEVTVRGSVAPLIGVGVGFDPELSGRENVFLNGKLLGLSHRQVRDRYDEIVAFSELGDRVNSPVKYYSSGMFLRLAFAVAVHVEPEILLIDEVLAVGDLGFQMKCIERLQKLKAAGTTIVVVTHNMQTLNQMCERAIHLNRGVVLFDGPTDQAISNYYEFTSDEEHSDAPDHVTAQYGDVVGGAVVSLELFDKDGRATNNLVTGEPWSLMMRSEFDREVDEPIVGIAVTRHEASIPVYLHQTYPGEYRGRHDRDRGLSATFKLRGNLLPGSYAVHAVVAETDGVRIVGTSPSLLFAVSSLHRRAGISDLAAQVEVEGQFIETPPISRL